MNPARIFTPTLSMLVLMAALLIGPHAVDAQVADSSTLFRTLKEKDSLVFNIAFNTCHLGPLDTLISDDFEFYHDRGGITRTKTDFINSIKTNICSISYKPRRELVEGSLKVFPLYSNGTLYGAIQSGKHLFYAVKEGQPDKLTGIALFTTLWIKNGNSWQMKRILSYDHQEPTGLTAPTTGQSDARTDKEGVAIFDNEKSIRQWLADNHIPAVGIGVITNGKLQDVKVFGEIKKGEPASYNTIFSIASLTKPITSLLTLKLVSMGMWDLDEPLDHYWIDPDIKGDPRHAKLTTRIILSHQTGFPNWRYLNADHKLAFQFDPGTKYQYSGEGFEYLRNALEHKFHTTLDKLADSLLFKPLEMHDTRYTWSDKIDTSRYARGFDQKGNIYPINKNTKANAADLVRTTVADYGTLLVALMKGQLLSPAVYGKMIIPQVKTKDGKSMGLGWEIYDLGKGEFALGHGGSEDGVHTQVLLLPQSGKGLVIFTNVDEGYKAYFKLIPAYLGDAGKRILDIELK